MATNDVYRSNPKRRRVLEARRNEDENAAVDTYSELVKPRSSCRRKSGETHPANYFVFTMEQAFIEHALVFDPNPTRKFGPYYFEIPFKQEDDFVQSLVRHYEEGHMKAVNEIVSVVFKPFIDVDKVPMDADEIRVNDYVYELLRSIYANTFNLPHQGKRRVLVMTTNPLHVMRGFPYRSDVNKTMAYLNKQGGFGLHIVFYQEYILREQFCPWIDWVYTKAPGEFTHLVDTFNTQRNSDCLIKLRLPLCDNGKKGFPGAPYVPMMNLEVEMDVDEGKVRIRDCGALKPNEVMLFGSLRLPQEHETLLDRTTGQIPKGRYNDNVQRYFATSLFTNEFNERFQREYPAHFFHLQYRIQSQCAPLIAKENSGISLSGCPLDIYRVSLLIQDQLKILNSKIRGWFALSPNLPSFQEKNPYVLSVVNHCVHLMNRVVFYNSRDCKFYYVSHSTDLDTYELVQATNQDNFGITEDIYIFAETHSIVKANARTNQETVVEVAPSGFHLFPKADMAHKIVGFIQYWKDGHFNRASDIVFDPSTHDGYEGDTMKKAREENRFVVNTFTGYKVTVKELREKYEKAKQDPDRMKLLVQFRKYIRYVLLGGNIPEDYIEVESKSYLLAFEAWFKRILMRPEEKTEVVLYISGDQATGKSNFANWFIKHVFGPHSPHKIVSSDGSQIYGNFTLPNLKKLLFLSIDEGSVNSKRREQDNVKQMVTAETTTSNVKNRLQEEVRIRINVMGSSNAKKLVVKVGDRRFLVNHNWTLDRGDPRVAFYYTDHITGQVTNNVGDYIEFCDRHDVFLLWLCFIACENHLPEVIIPRKKLQPLMPITFAYQDYLCFHMGPTHRWWKACLMRRKFPGKPFGIKRVKGQRSMLTRPERKEKYAAMMRDEETCKKLYEAWKQAPETVRQAYISQYGTKGKSTFIKEKIDEMIRPYNMTGQEIQDYYDGLTNKEKVGYIALAQKRGTPVNTEEERINNFIWVYNAQNELWLERAPMKYIVDHVREMAKSMKTKEQADVTAYAVLQDFAQLVKKSPAQFTQDVENDRYVTIPDFLTCLKVFADINRFSGRYIEHIASTISKHVDVAPWGDSTHAIDFLTTEDPDLYTEERRSGPSPTVSDIDAFMEELD